MRIVSIVGARPQFVKLAPLSKRLRENHTEIILHTGQHYDDSMSQSLFSDLHIPAPDHFLDIRSASHGKQTGRMLEKIENVLLLESPDLVIVFGDTNSTLAGALAAAKLHLPTVHVEAGLRSYNRGMPEEINRIATDHVADYLFAPTRKAMDILTAEGLADRSHLTGDIMVDVLRDNAGIAAARKEVLSRLEVTPGKYYLVTLHRPYNVDEPSTLARIVKEFSNLDHPIVFPVHPRTERIISNNRIEVPQNCILSSPLGYLDFLCLENHARKIITDSGGVQKEAYLLKKPCITLRPETEWTETVEEGWNILVSASRGNLAETVCDFTPPLTQADFLGSDVALKMTRLISGLAT